MDNNFQQEIDSLSNNNNKQIEDAKQTLAYTRVYAYRLYKPTCFDIKKPRFENIVVGDDVRSFFRVSDEMEGCYYEFDAFKDKLELSMENSVETNDEQTFERTLKRRIMSIGSDISFLDEGNWIFSFDEPVNENTDFTKCWVFSANQQEVGFVSWEKDPAIFELGDERNPARDLEKSLIMVSMDTFKNLNGYSLNVQYGLPLELGKIDQLNLENVKLKGKVYNSLFNQIELKVNDEKNDKQNVDLIVKKAPMILNTIENSNNIKFWNLWYSSKLINFNKINELINKYKDLKELLVLPLQSKDTVFYEGKGKILYSKLRFLPNRNVNTVSGRYLTPKNDAEFSTAHNMMTNEVSIIKDFEVLQYQNILNEGAYLGLANLRNPEPARYFIHNFYWPNSPTEHYSKYTLNAARREVISYDVRSLEGTITFEDDKGEPRTIYNGVIEKASLMFMSRSSKQGYSDPIVRETEKIFTNKESFAHTFIATSVRNENENHGSAFGIPRKITKYDKTFDNALALAYFNAPGNVIPFEDCVGYENRKPSTNDYNNVELKIGWKTTQDDIKIIGGAETNQYRLSDLIKNMISYTSAYKKGFPNARFTPNGTPMNFMAKIKDKFANSNYTPQQVITNLIEDYKMRHPKDLETEQWKTFLELIPMLGNYILSDYCIGGGLNDQHQILLPFYLELENGVSPLGAWFDSENVHIPEPGDGEPRKTNIFIEGTNKIINETGELIDIDKETYQASIVSCEYQNNLSATIKSKWFDLSTFELSGNNNIINKQPSFSSSSVSRTFREVGNELKESDISTVPNEMNLSDEYISNIFNVLLSNEEEPLNYLRQFVGLDIEKLWIERDIKDMVKLVKGATEDMLNTTRNVDDELNEEIILNLSNDALMPIQLDFKGLFGNNLDIEFNWNYVNDLTLTNENIEEYINQKDEIMKSINDEDKIYSYIIENGSKVEQYIWEWNEDEKAFFNEEDNKITFDDIWEKLINPINEDIIYELLTTNFSKGTRSLQINSDIFNKNDNRVISTKLYL